MQRAGHALTDIEQHRPRDQRLSGGQGSQTEVAPPIVEVVVAVLIDPEAPEAPLIGERDDDVVAPAKEPELVGDPNVRLPVVVDPRELRCSRAGQDLGPARGRTKHLRDMVGVGVDDPVHDAADEAVSALDQRRRLGDRLAPREAFVLGVRERVRP